MRKFTRLLALARGHDPVKALTIAVVAGLVLVLIVMVVFDFAQIALGLLEPFSFVALTANTIDGIFAYSLTSFVTLIFLLLLMASIVLWTFERRKSVKLASDFTNIRENMIRINERCIKPTECLRGIIE